MGIGKAIKKAVKSVTKPVEKTLKVAGKAGEDLTKGALGLAGSVLTGGKTATTEATETPTAATVTAPTPAATVEAPNKDDVDTEDDSQTESGKKKTRASGKKSLSVARSSGGGINI